MNHDRKIVDGFLADSSVVEVLTKKQRDDLANFLIHLFSQYRQSKISREKICRYLREEGIKCEEAYEDVYTYGLMLYLAGWRLNKEGVRILNNSSRRESDDILEKLTRVRHNKEASIRAEFAAKAREYGLSPLRHS